MYIFFIPPHPFTPRLGVKVVELSGGVACSGCLKGRSMFLARYIKRSSRKKIAFLDNFEMTWTCPRVFVENEMLASSKWTCTSYYVSMSGLHKVAD
jgi:hypothetical protein